MKKQKIKEISATYNLDYWGAPYFKINAQAQFEITPLAEAGGAIAMPQLIQAIKDKALRFPLLLRFNDIIYHRLTSLHNSFLKAVKQYQYPASHMTVYPIKVNQQYSVVKSVLQQDQTRLGLEAGSKPELLAVLATAEKERLIICNGYKDKEYIRLALMAQKIGQKIIIVIEKYSELSLVLHQAKKLNIEPMLGVRIRLSSMGKGKWQNSGGEKSKFGLSSAQLLQLINQLKKQSALHYISLLHFHMGSQISSLSDLKQGVVEAVRCYIALEKNGANMRTLDVGGGLAIDYDGTHSQNMYSMSYSMDEYASMILKEVKTICDKEKVACPEIITESGRAIVAHHAMLITNIIETEHCLSDIALSGNESFSLRENFKLLKDKICSENLLQIYQKINTLRQHSYVLFSQGDLNLRQRAALDFEYYSACRDILSLINTEHELWNELSEILADKYFCNLSIFQSMPDIWGIDQVFPIMPLQRLDEATDRRAILYDLTCDSDGHIEFYAENQSIKNSLPLHSIKPDEEYYIGFFLLGAYQEILGDMHNLFGDTDTVNVHLNEAGGFDLVAEEWGDNADELLEYVHFDITDMLAAYRQKIAQANLNTAEKKQFMDVFESGLYGYTYFHKA